MKAFLNWRYYIVLVIGLVAIFGIFAIPNESLGMGAWTFNLIISKLIGLAAAYYNYKLTAYWEKKGLIPELSKFITEEE